MKTQNYWNHSPAWTGIQVAFHMDKNKLCKNQILLLSL